MYHVHWNLFPIFILITSSLLTLTHQDEPDASKINPPAPHQPHQETASAASATPSPGPASASAHHVPPQSAKIHTPGPGGARGGGRGGAAPTGSVNTQRGYQSNIVIKGDSNFVIMGGKNSTINFKWWLLYYSVLFYCAFLLWSRPISRIFNLGVGLCDDTKLGLHWTIMPVAY